MLFMIAIFLSLTILTLPGFPWSARAHQTLRRVTTKLKIKTATWRSEKPQSVSISAKLRGSGALIEALKGAQVVALESTSGYAAMTDADGRFTLPHLTWYPNAQYNLIVSVDRYHTKHLKIIAPSSYPQEGIVDAGELNYEEGEEVDERDNSARHLRVDVENDDYYRKLFDALTAHAGTDHEKIQAINKYVVTRHNPKENAWGFKSARQIIERGAPHCSNLAFAMAIVCAAGGYPSRTIHTTDDIQYSNTHVAIEIYYGESWHLYDPTYGVFFPNEKGIVMSYKELRLNPDLITSEAFPKFEPDAISGILAWMPKTYSSGLHQLYQVKNGELCLVW